MPFCQDWTRRILLRRNAFPRIIPSIRKGSSIDSERPSAPTAPQDTPEVVGIGRQKGVGRTLFLLAVDEEARPAVGPLGPAHMLCTLCRLSLPIDLTCALVDRGDVLRAARARRIGCDGQFTGCRRRRRGAANRAPLCGADGLYRGGSGRGDGADRGAHLREDDPFGTRPRRLDASDGKTLCTEPGYQTEAREEA